TEAGMFTDESQLFLGEVPGCELDEVERPEPRELFEQLVDAAIKVAVAVFVPVEGRQRRSVAAGGDLPGAYQPVGSFRIDQVAHDGERTERAAPFRGVEPVVVEPREHGAQGTGGAGQHFSRASQREVHPFPATATRTARRSPVGTAYVTAAARRRGVLDQRIGRFPPTLTLWLAMAQEAPPAGSDEERPLPDLSRYEAVLF